MSGRKNRSSVLVIESDDAIRATMEWLLSERGYDVRVARTSAEALASDACGRPDLILSDITGVGAEGPDGPIRVAGKLGARVVFMSAQADQPLVRSAVAHGGVWLLPKPFTPDGLLRTLEDVLDA